VTQRINFQALFDLEATNQDLKPYLRDLYIMSAKEIETVAARKAIVIHVRPMCIR
jgi:Ribosomal protein S7e